MPEDESREIAPKGEVLLPARNNAIAELGWKRPAVRIFVSGALLLSIAAWLGSNFFQLRGYVNIAASRIDLAICAACLIGWIWIWARSIAIPKRLVPTLASALVLIMTFVVDKVTLPHSNRAQDLSSTAPPTKDRLAGQQEKAEQPGMQQGQPQASPHPQPSSSLASRPYDLTDERRKGFLRLLRPPSSGADKIRVGCIGWSERTCVAAGQFLVLFSQAGWTIQEDRVFRMDEPIPTEGVSVVSRPEPGPPLPPHLGRWHQLSLSETTLATAFIAMGVAENGSTDPSLADGTVGVYFGIEPESLKFNKGQISIWLASRLQREIDAIEQQPSSDPNSQSQHETDWNTEAEDWLRGNIGESAALHFHQFAGEKAKEDYFTRERILVQLKQSGSARACFINIV